MWSRKHGDNTLDVYPVRSQELIYPGDVVIIVERNISNQFRGRHSIAKLRPSVVPRIDQHDIAVAILQHLVGSNYDVLTFAQFEFASREHYEMLWEEGPPFWTRREEL